MKVSTNGTQKEAQILNITGKQSTYMSYGVDYDTKKPEQTIRIFVSDIKDMVQKYERNSERLFEIENELQDLYHYIEMAPAKNVPQGYKLYRKMKDLRCERRICKNENDLLQPIYEYFHATEVLNRLTHVQGECAKMTGTIDARRYQVRTDILDEFLNQKDEEPEPEEEKEDVFDQKALEIPKLPLEEMDDPSTLKSPSKSTQNKPMSAFKPVWHAAEA